METIFIDDQIEKELTVNENTGNVSNLISNYQKNQVQETYTGIIVQYFPRRNYGFLRQLDNSIGTNKKDFFFHKSQLIDQSVQPLATAGDLCEFSVEQGRSGEMAVSIRILQHNKARIQEPSKFKKNKKHQNSNTNKEKLFKDSLLLLFNAATNPKHKF